ncbi:MAG: VTT domain-containing protein [Actinomycetota bacterium]|nr:VTT domain-containing protein [Actinomycetota bacterium]
MTSTTPGGGTWRGVGLTVAAIVAGLAIAFAIAPLREAILDVISGDTASVRQDLRDLGAWGVAMVAALAMVHTVIWYPAEILNAAAGYVYGFGAAMALIMVCWMANALAAYAIGSNAGRPLLYRLAGEQRFTRVETAVNEGGATLLLAMRLIPIVPFSLFSIAAGAARVPLWRFCWTTAIGYLPITAIFVYLGSQLEELSPTDPLLWASALALIAMLFGLRYLRPRLGRG